MLERTFTTTTSPSPPTTRASSRHMVTCQLRLAPLVRAQPVGQLFDINRNRAPTPTPPSRRRRPRQRGRRVQHAGRRAVHAGAVVPDQQPVRHHPAMSFGAPIPNPANPSWDSPVHQLRQRRPVQLLQRAVVDLGTPQLQGRRLRRAPDEHRGQGRQRAGGTLRLQPRSGEPVRHGPPVRQRPRRIVPVVPGEHRPAGATRQPVDRQRLRAGQVAAGRPPDAGHRHALQQVHGVRAGEPLGLVPAVALRPHQRGAALHAHHGERRPDGDEPERPADIRPEVVIGALVPDRPATTAWCATTIRRCRPRSRTCRRSC